MKSIFHATILTGGTAQARLDAAAARMADSLCLASERQACLQCAACRKVLTWGHPDVTALSPEGRDIVVAQVRALRSDMFLVPHEGRLKWVVVEADALNLHAQNALLALLEEPPSYARFLLLSANPCQLLPTVRSRCAVVFLSDAPEELAPAPEAQRIMTALASDDEWSVVSACLSLEKAERASVNIALDGLAHLICRAVVHTDVLTARRFGSIIDQIRQLQAMLEANVGVGHVCGALAALLCDESGRVCVSHTPEGAPHRAV